MSARRFTKPKVVSVKVTGQCAWCRQELEYPARYNALVYCPNKNVRALTVPAELPRYTLADRHQLVEAAELQRLTPKPGLGARIAAAAASALHVFKAGGR